MVWSGKPLGTHQFTGPAVGVKGGKLGKDSYVANLASHITPPYRLL
jgi:hypothetical protein